MSEQNELEFNGLLTKEEFLALAESVKRNDEIDEAEVEKLVNWAIEKRSGAMCVDLLIQGFFKVEGWESEAPLLSPVDEITEAMSYFGSLKTPMLEESQCS